MGGETGRERGERGAARLCVCACVRVFVCVCTCACVDAGGGGGGRYIEICKALLNSVVYWCNVSCVVSYMYSALGEAR